MIGHKTKSIYLNYVSKPGEHIALLILELFGAKAPCKQKLKQFVVSFIYKEQIFIVTTIVHMIKRIRNFNSYNIPYRHSPYYKLSWGETLTLDPRETLTPWFKRSVLVKGKKM